MISDIFFMSIDALRSRKARTFLTLLGVIIGTGSVIMVSSAGASLEIYVKEQWNIFDPTGIIIGIGYATNPPQITFREIVFTDRDVENIRNLPHVANVAPVGIVTLNKVSIRNSFLNWESRTGGSLYASNEGMLDVLNVTITRGRLFEEGKNEIVISESYSQLFGTENVLDVGDMLYLTRIDGRMMKANIVGIMKEQEGLNILSSLTAPSILGPIDPFYSTFPGANVGGILQKKTAYGLLYANADSLDNVFLAEQEIKQYLESGGSDAEQYKNKQSAFVVITQEYILLRIDELMNVVNMFITAIAVVSLIVGGIGIANIMYATVTERTREIGTMMALGAKRRMILQMFVLQSAIIGLLGGIIGCMIGAGGGYFIVELITRYIEQLNVGSVTGSLPIVYSFEWFIIATISGLLVGIIAGVLPAIRAAKMDPVTALRYE